MDFDFWLALFWNYSYSIWYKVEGCGQINPENIPLTFPQTFWEKVRKNPDHDNINPRHFSAFGSVLRKGKNLHVVDKYGPQKKIMMRIMRQNGILRVNLRFTCKNSTRGRIFRMHLDSFLLHPHYYLW